MTQGRGLIQKLKRELTTSYPIIVVQHLAADLFAINEGSIAAVQIENCALPAIKQDLGVLTRDRRVGDSNHVALVASYGNLCHLLMDLNDHVISISPAKS